MLNIWSVENVFEEYLYKIIKFEIVEYEEYFKVTEKNETKWRMNCFEEDCNK